MSVSVHFKFIVRTAPLTEEERKAMRDAEKAKLMGLLDGKAKEPEPPQPPAEPAKE